MKWLWTHLKSLFFPSAPLDGSIQNDRAWQGSPHRSLTEICICLSINSNSLYIERLPTDYAAFLWPVTDCEEQSSKDRGCKTSKMLPFSENPAFRKEAAGSMNKVLYHYSAAQPLDSSVSFGISLLDTSWIESAEDSCSFATTPMFGRFNSFLWMGVCMCYQHVRKYIIHLHKSDLNNIHCPLNQ